VIIKGNMSEQPPTYSYRTSNTSPWGYIVFGIIVGAVVMGLGLSLMTHKLEKQAQWEIKKEALLNGNAFYKPDSVTAEPVFTWNN
jgi:hypothetical protein